LVRQTSDHLVVGNLTRQSGSVAGWLSGLERKTAAPKDGRRCETSIVYLGGQRSQYFAQLGHSVHDRTSASVNHA
jgi:hypothetical protein